MARSSPSTAARTIACPAAVEGELLAIGHGGLRPRGACGKPGGDRQQDVKDGRPWKGGQGVIPRRYVDDLVRGNIVFQSTKGIG